jgi:hypothetical protein
MTKWEQEHRDFQIAFDWVAPDKENDSEFPCSMGTYENFSHSQDSVVERFNQPATEASKQGMRSGFLMQIEEVVPQQTTIVEVSSLETDESDQEQIWARPGSTRPRFRNPGQEIGVREPGAGWAAGKAAIRHCLASA